MCGLTQSCVEFFFQRCAGAPLHGQRDDYTKAAHAPGTRYFSEHTTLAAGEGAIEGTLEDYRLPSPFTTAFKYSRFELRAAAARNATALRAAALRAHLPAANATASSRIQMHVNYQGFDMGKRRRRRVPTPEACYEECRRARGCAAFTYVLTQQHKPSEYACFLKQRGFEAGASYSGGTASGIVEK